MAIYYKFKSAKDYDSIPISGHFITVANLKEKIFVKNRMERGRDFDLIVANAQTNEEYLDQDMLVPKNTSVTIRRVPGPPSRAIVIQPDKPKVDTLAQDDQPAKSDLTAADSSGQVRIPVQDPVSSSKADEDNKIKFLVDNTGFDMQRQYNGFGQGRGVGRGGLGFITPPQYYVCHRCNVPGHFIQHCPTNGDPDYDIKKEKRPTLVVVKAHEDAFDKEMEILSSSRSCGDLPPELHCPLCKEVMKNAVLSSKCCFKSFCDKCIRDHIISKSLCVCGVRDVLADDLLPNNTLRDTINRILDAGNSSADNTGGSVHQVQEFAVDPQPENPLPTQSAASKGEQKLTPHGEETPKLKEKIDGSEVVDALPQLVLLQTSSDEKTATVPDASEATHVAVTLKESALQSSAQPVVEVQQKVAVFEAGNNKQKKVPPIVNDMRRMGVHHNMNGYMNPSAFSPFWPGDSNMMSYNMRYGPGPLNMHFSYFNSPVPFGAQHYMIPPMVPPSQRNPAKEFDSRMVGVKRKQEMDTQNKRDPPKVHYYDRGTDDYGREACRSGNVPPVNSKLIRGSRRTPPHRSPSEEKYYNHHHEREHDTKRRKTNRTSLNYDHSHASYDLTYHRHRSRDHESRDFDEPQQKRKSKQRELGRKKDEGHHHYGYEESSHRHQSRDHVSPDLDEPQPKRRSGRHERERKVAKGRHHYGSI